MNKTIRNLAIAALFIFLGISGFPQEVQQDETPAAKPVVEENVAFPILMRPRDIAVCAVGPIEILV